MYRDNYFKTDYLLKHGCDPNHICDFNNLTILSNAAYLGSCESAKALLDNGADPNLKNPDGSTPYTRAKHINDVEKRERMQKLLKDYGAEVSEKERIQDALKEYRAKNS